jgi:hypothetical protein
LLRCKLKSAIVTATHGLSVKYRRLHALPQQLLLFCQESRNLLPKACKLAKLAALQEDIMLATARVERKSGKVKGSGAIRYRWCQGPLIPFSQQERRCCVFRKPRFAAPALLCKRAPPSKPKTARTQRFCCTSYKIALLCSSSLYVAQPRSTLRNLALRCATSLYVAHPRSTLLMLAQHCSSSLYTA